MNKKISRFTSILTYFTLSLMVVFALSGCSNSSPNTEESASVNPAGIWLGTQTVLEKDADGNVLSDAFDMKAFIYDGHFYGLSEGANIIFSGTYEMGSNGRMIVDGSETGNQTYKMYTISEQGTSWVDGIAVLNFTEKESFFGRFQNDAYQEGEMQARYSSLYEKGASLDSLVGDYATDSMSIILDGSGTFQGSKNSCSISGEISVPDDQINIYKLDYTLSGDGCADKAGHYSGLGIIALDANSGSYFLGLSNNDDDTRMDALYLPQVETPLSFTVAQIDNALSDFIGLHSGQKISEKMTAFVDPDNWPNLVSKAMANLLNPVIWYDKSTIQDSGTDATNQEILSMSDVVSFSTRKPAPEREGEELSLENVDFTNSDFNSISFTTVIADSENSEIYTELRDMIFDGANMENVHFATNQPIFCCYLENTNLEGSNISDVNLSPFVYDDDFIPQYVPYSERPATSDDEYTPSYNDYSGAWWEDGHRCGLDLGLARSGKCTINLLDSGLTYAEWKDGKWEAEKIAENIASEVEDLAEGGVELVKDIGSYFMSFDAFQW